MKILFITENYPPETNAAATRVSERVPYWLGAGHDVTIITTAPNFPAGKLHDGYRNRWKSVEWIDGAKVVRVWSYISANEGFFRRTVDFISFMLTGTLAALREPRPDVVVATSPQFFSAVAGWMIGKFRRRPFVFELGDLWPASISAVGAMEKGRLIALLERLELFLYRQSECVVALTHAFKRNLVSRGIESSKIAVVRNGVEVSHYSPQPRDADLESALELKGCFVVGYIGTHGMAHDLMNVIRAAEKSNGASRLRFLFVGAGAEKPALVAAAKERQLKNVVFVDSVPKSEVRRYWSLCDLALIHLKDDPVFAEVIPSKLFEAMGMGIPVLMAAPAGEASEIVTTENVGTWVGAGNPDALLSAAETLADSPTQVAKMRRQCVERVASFSREQQAVDMLSVLELATLGKGQEVAE